jgi:uncharacterized protein with FMN-binding domain
MVPRRAAAAVIVTALGLVLLFSFRTPSVPTMAVTGGGVAPAVEQPASGTPAPVAPDASASPTPVGRAAQGTRSGSAIPTPKPVAPSAAQGDGQYTGTVVNMRYGAVQVQATISNGKIVDVTALQMPSNDRHSAQISQYVEPVLRSSALQAQSAQIDLVSGATYTSQAYAQSLQDALDRAGM